MVERAANVRWTWPDAWVLAATSDLAEGCTLSELMGAADAINHAVPTRDELASALGALIAAGLIEVKDGRFRTTDAGRAIKKHWRGGLFGWSESLLPQLERLPRATDEFSLTEAAVQAAYTEYVRRIKV
jgi:hypothetical protein